MPCKARVCEPGKWAQCATCHEQKGKLHNQLGAAPSVKVTAYPYRKNLIRIKRARIWTKGEGGRKVHDRNTTAEKPRDLRAEHESGVMMKIYRGCESPHPHMKIPG